MSPSAATFKSLLILLTSLVLIEACFFRAWRGMLDDGFAYATTTRGLVEEGRLVVSDWASASYVGQSLWSAAWCWIGGGYSFVACNASAVALACLAPVALYLIAVDAGVAPRTSAAVALAFFMSPTALRYANVFMTDMPALGVGGLALWLMLRMAHDGEAGWRQTAVAAGLLVFGVSIRQTVGLVALAGLTVGLFGRPRLVVACLPAVVVAGAWAGGEGLGWLAAPLARQDTLYSHGFADLLTSDGLRIIGVRIAAYTVLASQCLAPALALATLAAPRAVIRGLREAWWGAAIAFVGSLALLVLIPIEERVVGFDLTAPPAIPRSSVLLIDALCLTLSSIWIAVAWVYRRRFCRTAMMLVVGSMTLVAAATLTAEWAWDEYVLPIVFLALAGLLIAGGRALQSVSLVPLAAVVAICAIAATPTWSRLDFAGQEWAIALRAVDGGVSPDEISEPSFGFHHWFYYQQAMDEVRRTVPARERARRWLWKGPDRGKVRYYWVEHPPNPGAKVLGYASSRDVFQVRRAWLVEIVR